MEADDDEVVSTRRSRPTSSRPGSSSPSRSARRSGSTRRPAPLDEVPDDEDEDTQEDDDDYEDDEDEDYDDDEDDEEDDEASAQGPRGGGGGVRLTIPVPSLRIVGIVTGVVVVAAVALVIGLLLGSGGKGSKALASVSGPYKSYTDNTNGYSIKYPQSWTIRSGGNDLVVTGNGQDVSLGATDGFEIYVDQLQHSIKTTDLSSMRSVTDAILQSENSGLVVLTETPVKVGTLPGYKYYYYASSGTGQGSTSVGEHLMYFLFQGRKLLVIHFQALPASDFDGLQGTFVRIVHTLRSNGAVLGSVPTTIPGSSPTTAPAG